MPSNKEILDRIKSSNNQFVIGIDEVGYGCIAGPIYVCAFLASKDWAHSDVDDSKVLSKNKREFLYEELIGINNIEYSIVNIHPNSNDEYKEYGTNVHATLKCLYWRAASELLEHKKNALIVLDGNIKFPEHPYSLGEAVSLPKADSLIPHVSAASIIAKVSRDHYMTQLAKQYPQYNWETNKGYPTPDHLAAVKKYGYVDEHRKMYEPIKSMIK